MPQLPNNPEFDIVNYEASINEAISQLINEPEKYYGVILALREKKSAGEVLQRVGDAISEIGKDLPAVTVAAKETIHSIRSGVETSEFKMASATNKVLTIIACLAPLLDAVMVAIEQNGGEMFGNSLWLSGVSIALKVFITDRYSTARENLKHATIQANSAINL